MKRFVIGPLFVFLFILFSLGCSSSTDCQNTPTKTCPTCPGKPTLPVIDNSVVAKDIRAYWIDLVLDNSSNPHVHVSYYDADKGDLYYAHTDDNGKWINELVDSDGDVGMYSSIGLVGSMPVIAYYDNSYGRLKLAYKKNNIWNNVVIDNSPQVGAWCDLAVDINGMVNISYIDQKNQDLKFARWDPQGNILVEELDDGITKSGGGVISNQTSIALDSLGKAHIAYYDGYLGDLRYIYYDYKTGEWVKETVDDPPVGDDSQENLGRWNSIYLDSDDNPYIAYSDETNFRVKFAYKKDGKWVNEMLETYDRADSFISLLLLDKTPVISFFDSDYSDLRIARKENGKWNFDVVDSVGITGEYAKMVSGPADHLYFAYRSYTYDQVLLQVLDSVK